MARAGARADAAPAEELLPQAVLCLACRSHTRAPPHFEQRASDPNAHVHAEMPDRAPPFVQGCRRDGIFGDIRKNSPGPTTTYDR